MSGSWIKDIAVIYGVMKHIQQSTVVSLGARIYAVLLSKCPALG